MKSFKSAFLITLVLLLSLCFALVAACGDDDDDDADDIDDDSGGGDNDDDANDDVYDDDDTEETCLDGEIWDDELGLCIPEECGLDKYPEAPFDDKALIYVDASYTGGSDGSSEKPYKTISEALDNASEDTSILIASGDYVESETLTFAAHGLDLVGRCSYLSKLSSEVNFRTVLTLYPSDSNLIQGIKFHSNGESSHDFPLVELTGTSRTEFRDNSVIGSTGQGLKVNSCEEILILGNFMEDNSHTGIFVSESNGEISENEVYSTGSDGQGDNGTGIWIQNSEGISVSDNIVEYSKNVGIFFGNVDGTISGNNVGSNTTMGVAFIDSSGTVLANDIHDNLDRGINVQNSEDVSIASNIVEGNAESGIFFSHSDGTISDNEVRETRPNEQNNFGLGIVVQDSEEVLVLDNIVESNTEVGIYISTSSASISGNKVRDTQPSSSNDEDYTYGHGIHIQASSNVECSLNLVENNVHAGIFYILTTDGNIHENQVSQTLAESRDTSERGDGIIVLGIDGFISIQDNTLEDNDRCGILADSSTGMIERNGIFGNENSIVAQNASDMDISDNDIQDNDINDVQYFDNRELPISDSMIEMN